MVFKCSLFPQSGLSVNELDQPYNIPHTSNSESFSDVKLVKDCLVDCAVRRKDAFACYGSAGEP